MHHRLIFILSTVSPWRLNAEEPGEIWHGDAGLYRSWIPLLYKTMGSSCQLYLELPGSNNGHTGVSYLEIGQHQESNIKDSYWCPLRCCYGSWGRFPRLQGQHNWHTLDSLWRSNADVSGQMPCLYYHVNQMLVQWRFPAIHKKTDQAVQSQCLLPNVDLHVT